MFVPVAFAISRASASTRSDNLRDRSSSAGARTGDADDFVTARSTRRAEPILTSPYTPRRRGVASHAQTVQREAVDSLDALCA
jgi:hypothetical protein